LCRKKYEFWQFILGVVHLHTVNIMYEDLSEKFEKFKEIHYEFNDLVVFSNQGEIFFQTESANLNPRDCQNILDSWLHHEKDVILHEIRYSILKTDIYQYAALNPSLKRGIVGSMDKEFNYAIGLVESERNPENFLLLSSIELNKLVWDMN